jgi:hypothetical protein
MKDKILKITNASYGIIEFFPESDPLKNRSKDKALAIMENIIFLNNTDGWASLQNEKLKIQISEDIDILMGYFWIAKAQNWMSPINYFIISNEYEKIKPNKNPIGHFDGSAIIPPEASLSGIEEKIQPVEKAQIVSELVLDKNEAHKTVASKSLLGFRQKKIVEFLENKQKAQVMDLQKILPDVTKRTIRRDLDELLQIGKIVRTGEFNQVFYTLRG